MAAKHRSPSYPAISLPDAVALARRLYPGAKRSIGATVVAEQWGYNGISSASPYIAALKHFGLLDEEKANGDRMLKLSEPALDIVVDPDGTTTEFRIAVQNAALAPRIHQELWERWGKDLPPDSEIRRYLERERDFNPKYVGGFIEEYKATLAFSGLLSDDTIREKAKREAEEKEAAEAEEKRRRTFDPSIFSSLFSPPPPKPMQAQMRELPITLPSLAVAVVRVPERMSELDFNTLVNMINAWKSALVSMPETPQPASKSADDDQSQGLGAAT